MECEPFQLVCPLLNYQPLEMFPVFPVFPVFSWKKKRKFEKKLRDKNGPNTAVSHARVSAMLLCMPRVGDRQASPTFPRSSARPGQLRVVPWCWKGAVSNFVFVKLRPCLWYYRSLRVPKTFDGTGSLYWEQHKRKHPLPCISYERRVDGHLPVAMWARAACPQDC